MSDQKKKKTDKRNGKNQKNTEKLVPPKAKN